MESYLTTCLLAKGNDLFNDRPQVQRSSTAGGKRHLSNCWIFLWVEKNQTAGFTLYEGFHSHGGTPQKMDGFLREKPIKMEDLGVHLF